jgi:hypothetical protein
MSNLTEDKSLREFWARCTDQNLLYIQPEKLVTCLDQKYGAQLKSKYERDPKRGKNCKIPRGFLSPAPAKWSGGYGNDWRPSEICCKCSKIFIC